ncbi:hypothetical protein QVD17_15838 [Tagetes erecta]|uniref:Uncharacterized protein n=1 Tax=Tagetes erecta TaxID=13708 RepID=A0AAD8NT05_TARER|nr:hypothetical protein QVD17_15838 [Tagetes erecta]
MKMVGRLGIRLVQLGHMNQFRTEYIVSDSMIMNQSEKARFKDETCVHNNLCFLINYGSKQAVPGVSTGSTRHSWLA